MLGNLHQRPWLLAVIGNALQYRSPSQAPCQLPANSFPTGIDSTSFPLTFSSTIPIPAKEFCATSNINLFMRRQLMQKYGNRDIYDYEQLYFCFITKTKTYIVTKCIYKSYKYTNIEIYKYINIETYKCINIEMYKSILKTSDNTRGKGIPRLKQCQYFCGRIYLQTIDKTKNVLLLNRTVFLRGGFNCKMCFCADKNKSCPKPLRFWEMKISQLNFQTLGIWKA